MIQVPDTKLKSDTSLTKDVKWMIRFRYGLKVSKTKYTEISETHQPCKILKK